MDLESELQQKKFENEKHKLVLNVMFTAGWLDCQAIRHLKPHGLSPQQYNVLRILRGQSGTAVSANLVASRMIDRSSNVSRLIEKLFQKSLVSREENTADRRAVCIAISQKGLNLLAKIDKDRTSLNNSTKQISDADAKVVNTILDKLRD